MPKWKPKWKPKCIPNRWLLSFGEVSKTVFKNRRQNDTKIVPKRSPGRPQEASKWHRKSIRNRRKSLAIDENGEKSMKNYEKRWNIEATRWKIMKNRWKSMNLDEKMTNLNDKLPQDFRSHTSKTQRPPLKGVTCGRNRQSLPFLRVRPPLGRAATFQFLTEPCFTWCV